MSFPLILQIASNLKKNNELYAFLNKLTSLAPFFFLLSFTILKSPQPSSLNTKILKSKKKKEKI